jgi:hypothetical protein
MAPQAVQKGGRPLYSRLVRGYKGDLDALERLRRACFEDTRITSEKYTRIVDALRRVRRELRGFVKGRKTRTH